MVADAAAGLEHDEVEAEREPRDRCAIGQRPTIEEAVGGLPDPDPLAMIDRLLWEAEGTVRAPAHLDDHECRRRTRVDGDQVDLVPADVDVPGEHRPSGCLESGGHERLGGVSGTLGVGPRTPR